MALNRFRFVAFFTALVLTPACRWCDGGGGMEESWYRGDSARSFPWGTTWFEYHFVGRNIQPPPFDINIVPRSHDGGTVPVTVEVNESRTEMWYRHPRLEEGVYTELIVETDDPGTDYDIDAADHGLFPWAAPSPGSRWDSRPARRAGCVPVTASDAGFRMACLELTLYFDGTRRHYQPAPVMDTMHVDGARLSWTSQLGDPKPPEGFPQRLTLGDWAVGVTVRSGGIDWYVVAQSAVALSMSLWAGVPAFPVLAGRVEDLPQGMRMAFNPPGPACGLAATVRGGETVVLLATLYATVLVLLAQDASGTWAFRETVATPWTLCGITAVDLDGDGVDEYAATTPEADGLVLLRWEPDAPERMTAIQGTLDGGWWPAVGAWEVPKHQFAPTLADVDRDGRTDMLLNHNGWTEIWYNESRSGEFRFDVRTWQMIGDPYVVWVESLQRTLLGLGSGGIEMNGREPGRHVDYRFQVAFSPGGLPAWIVDVDGDGQKDVIAQNEAWPILLWRDAYPEMEPPVFVYRYELLDGGVRVLDAGFP